MALPDRSASGLAHDGEGLGQKIFQGFAREVTAAELGGLVAQLLVGELLDLGLETVDLVNERLNAFQVSFGAVPDEAGNEA